jgi:hypothetical protein
MQVRVVRRLQEHASVELAIYQAENSPKPAPSFSLEAIRQTSRQVIAVSRRRN